MAGSNDERRQTQEEIVKNEKERYECCRDKLCKSPKIREK